MIHAKAPAIRRPRHFDEFIDWSYGYSLIDVATGSPSCGSHPSIPARSRTRRSRRLRRARRRRRAIALRRSRSCHATGVVTKALGSPPRRSASCPAPQAYVAQRHLRPGVVPPARQRPVRTVTGFDLNGDVNPISEPRARPRRTACSWEDDRPIAWDRPRRCSVDPDEVTGRVRRLRARSRDAARPRPDRRAARCGSAAARRGAEPGSPSVVIARRRRPRRRDRRAPQFG